MTSGGMRAVTLAVVAAVGLTVTALAGCGGQAAQGAPAPTRAAATQVLVPRPPPKTPQTRDGALEFLYAYVAERDRAYITNDDSVVIAYSSPACPCTGLIKEKLTQRRADGLIAVGPTDTLAHITQIGRWEEHGAQRKIGLEIEVPPVDVQNKTGRVVLHEDALIQRELFTLSYDRDHWIIEDSIGYRRPKPQ